MCGISCVIQLRSSDSRSTNGLPNGTEKSAEPQRQRLSKQLAESLEMIKHRGPDARGQWISDDNRVALGHVRLSINDLSPDGAQPFHDAKRTVHAVVNGEFYDYDRIRAELEEKAGYVFRSRSDSEIVIALYATHGLNFVHHLRGEFSCVLYDEEAQFLVAVRDRYGIKPLFWTVQNNRLLIAAEMKAFLPFDWQPEWDVRSLKDAGWNHDERTFFQGVQKIRPGHYLTCSSFGRLETRQYWDIEYPNKHILDHRTPEEIIEAVREHLLNSIRLRLRADVPIGIYLSGGIDSSVIAGMVTHLVREQGISMGSAGPEERVTCFSIAFDEDSGFDESDISNRTAEWLGVKYEKKLMNEEELAKRFEDATWHCEANNADLNYIGKFALSEVPLEHGYKVVLTGEGADESFAGYPMYLPDFLREPDDSWRFNTLPEGKRKEQLEITENFAAEYYESIGADASKRGPSVARQMVNDITTGSSMVAFQPDVFADWTDDALGVCDPQLTIANNADGRVRHKVLKDWHPLHSAEYFWTKGHLANIFLCCLGDRTEMAHSIEARTPFLDHELTEYVNNLPPSCKLRWDPEQERFIEKWVLKEASKPFITKELYERKKHPFSAPTHWPADGPLHRLMASLLTQANVDQLGFVSWERCRHLVQDAFEKASPKAMRLAVLVAQWIVLGQRFGVKRAVP